MQWFLWSKITVLTHSRSFTLTNMLYNGDFLCFKYPNIHQILFRICPAKCITLHPHSKNRFMFWFSTLNWTKCFCSTCSKTLYKGHLLISRTWCTLDWLQGSREAINSILGWHGFCSHANVLTDKSTQN